MMATTLPPPPGPPPGPPPRPARAESTPGERRAWLWTLAVLPVAGLLFDLATMTFASGVALALSVVVLAAGLVTVGKVDGPDGRALAAAAVVPALFVAVRLSPWLLIPDVAAVAVLLGLAVSSSGPAGRERPFFDLGFWRVGLAVVTTSGAVAAAPGLLVDAIPALRRPHREHRPRLWMAVARGLALAVPVVVVIGLLLASSDAVFASLFRSPLDLSNLSGHLAVVFVGMWGTAGLFFRARWPSTAPTRTPRPVLGTTEAATVLGGLIVVYAVFAYSRVLVNVRGEQYVLETTGMTYAEYARSGFFPLLWAAGTTLVVLLGLRAAVDLSQARDRRVLAGLSLPAVALTLVLVQSALSRLDLYDDAFGLTMLRLSCTIFAWWLGAVFVLTGISLAGVGAGRRWLAGAVLCSAFATLVLVNLMNPEALVVGHNADRAAVTGRFDSYYVEQLSSDAVPALVAAWPRLPADDKAEILQVWCVSERKAAQRYRDPDANLSSIRAHDALRRFCTS